jgi:hypothetical protein
MRAAVASGPSPGPNTGAMICLIRASVQAHRLSALLAHVGPQRIDGLVCQSPAVDNPLRMRPMTSSRGGVAKAGDPQNCCAPLPPPRLPKEGGESRPVVNGVDATTGLTRLTGGSPE